MPVKNRENQTDPCLTSNSIKYIIALETTGAGICCASLRSTCRLFAGAQSGAGGHWAALSQVRRRGRRDRGLRRSEPQGSADGGQLPCRLKCVEAARRFRRRSARHPVVGGVREDRSGALKKVRLRNHGHKNPGGLVLSETTCITQEFLL